MRRIEASRPGLPDEWIADRDRALEPGFPAERRGTAPGRAARLVSAGQAERPQAGGALPRAGPADEGLAAPERPVAAVTHAVPRKDDRGRVHPVLGDERRGVGMVVQDRRVRLALRRDPARRRVTRVRVAEPVTRAHVVQLLQVAHDLFEDLLAAQRAHIAHVRRHDDAAVPREGHGELQVPADGEDGLRQRARQLEFERCRAAPEANRPRASGRDPHHRVIRGPHDRAVVVQERVGHRGQPLLGLGGLGQDRLATHVSGGRDDRPAESGEQQVVKRAVGQERSDLGEPGRDGGRKSRIRSRPGEHDGARGIE